MSPIEHELVCPLCRGPVVLDGPIQCGPPRYSLGRCGWSSTSAAEMVRSGRTRPNQNAPWRDMGGDHG